MTARASSAAAWMLLFGLPLAAGAQPAGRLTVTANVEYAHVTEDDGFLGAGLGGGGGLDVRLTDATSVGIQVGWTHHIRDLQFHAVAFDPQGRVDAFPFVMRWSGTATFVLGQVSHTFGASRLRPVVWAGGGLMHHGGTLVEPRTQPQIPPGYRLQAEDAEALAGARRGRGSNAATIDGGGGIEILVSDRVSLRPFAGLRLANTGNFGPKYLIRAGVRVGIRW